MSPVDSKRSNKYTTKVIRGALQLINTGCTKVGGAMGVWLVTPSFRCIVKLQD